MHGEKPNSPAGYVYESYDEIATSDKQFYKWSNDNNVYTELGAPGFQEVDDGILIFFLGENPALDNSKTGEYLNGPRNIGFVKINSDLEIISEGETEVGGFYTFQGAWTEL